MRTSPSQFEVIVDFMERNGDLNRPSDGPHGRLTTIEKWNELAGVLNMDTTGTFKPVDRWKKVWSDLKNNVKKKASKINRSASGTGGGPACRLVLTELEQRVLNIIGPQAVTGLQGVHELGIELPSVPVLPEETPELVTTPQRSPTPVQIEIIVEPSNGSNISHGSGEVTAVTVEEGLAPTRSHAQTPSRRRRTTRRVVETPRRRHRPPTQMEAVSRRFLASDDRWINFATQFATEQNRLRQVELEQQAQWQILFAKCIDILEKIANK